MNVDTVGQKESNQATRLREALNAQGVSQSDLARYCGVSKQTVSAWTNLNTSKRSVPSDTALEQIAQRLGISVGWVSGTSKSGGPKITDSPLNGSANHQGIRDSWIKKVRTLVTDIDPGKRNYFHRMLRAPGIDEAWRWDYASTKALVMLERSRVADPVSIRHHLWKLSIMKRTDHDAAVDRRYLVIGQFDTNQHSLTYEAELMEIELHLTKSAADTAKLLLTL